MGAALEMRAATRRVHQEQVGSLERGDVPFREAYGLRLVARVRVERPTTGLPWGVDDLGPKVRECARGGGVHVAIRRAHDAAQK